MDATSEIATLVGVVEVAFAATLLGGMFAVRRGQIRLHRNLQASVVLVNLPLAVLWMVPRFLTEVLPDLPGELLQPYYLLPTLGLLLGAVAEGLGVYIILVAATTWIPERYRFRRYKLWMRTALGLWWAVVAVGLGIYATWYLLPSGGS